MVGVGQRSTCGSELRFDRGDNVFHGNILLIVSEQSVQVQQGGGG